MKAATLACISVLMSTPVMAHGDAEWILQGGYKGANGASCCGPRDCLVVEGRFAPNGWVITNPLTRQSHAITIDTPGVHATPDGQYWGCWVQPEIASVPRCIFVPMIGM